MVAKIKILDVISFPSITRNGDNYTCIGSCTLKGEYDKQELYLQMVIAVRRCPHNEHGVKGSKTTVEIVSIDGFWAKDGWAKGAEINPKQLDIEEAVNGFIGRLMYEEFSERLAKGKVIDLSGDKLN